MENTQPKVNLISTHEEHARPAWMALHARKGMVLALMLADGLGLFTAGLLAVLLRHALLGSLPASYFLWMPPLAFLFLVVYWARGLYPALGLGAVDEFRNLTVTTSLAFLLTGAAVYLARGEGGFSRLAFSVTWLVSLMLVPAFRLIVRHLLTRLGLWGEPVAVIGPGEAARRAAEYFRRNPKIGLKPQQVITEMGRHPVGRGGPRTAVVVYECLGDVAGIREHYRDAYERVILVNVRGGDVDLGGMSVRQYGSLLSFEVRHSLLDRPAQTLKRIIDVLGAELGLLVLAIPLAIVAVLIRLDSPGGVFYVQKRLGKGGKEFGLLKFRTMHVNADALLHDHLAANPALREEWATYQKLKDDPRITRMGRFLRCFSIDELPQLWNVLLGDMSLVGPRPIMLNQRAMYGPNLKHYLRVAPGITGQWQISGRNQTSFAERTEFDVQYVMNWSVWLDIYILVRTVWVVLKRDGAC